MHFFTWITLAFTLLLVCAGPSFSQEKNTIEVNSGGVNGSLEEIKDKHRVLLLTSRSQMIDVQNSAQAIVDEIYKKDVSKRSFHYGAYRAIAVSLNNYIRKYRSLIPVQRVADADFIIVFKVHPGSRPATSEFRELIKGQMLVIKNGTPDDPEPSIVWRTKHDHAEVEDAIRDFIKALKAIRLEK